MNDAIQWTWQEVIQKLPGIYLNDQYPQGAGLAVSIEPREDRSWVIHYIKEQQGAAKRFKTKPLNSFDVYKKLESLFAEVGEPPRMTEEERRALGLPPKDELATVSLRHRMPGTWLGKSRDLENEFGWDTVYSVERKSNGKYVLYTCLELEENALVENPEIERVGEFDLSQLLDELRTLGFSKPVYSFLYTLSPVKGEDVKR